MIARADGKHRTRSALLLAIVLTVTTLLSIEPHLEGWLRGQGPSWIADYDELGLYLPVAARSFWHSPTSIGDPLFLEPRPVKYPASQFVPGILAVKTAGLGVEWLSVFWRLFAGLTIGASWFLLARRLFRTELAAAIGALLLSVDSGLLEGKIFYKTYALLARILAGQQEPLAGPPHVHPEWRIISPGLSLPFLLLFYWSVLRFRGREPRAYLIPGIFFGVLFYTYFYFWTAVGLGLLIGLVFEREHRGFYLRTGITGLLLGLPELLSNLRLKGATNPEWLQRSDKFLPIPHFSELILPKAGFLLVAFGLFAAWKYRHDLRFLAFQAVAGLVLLNHQIFTGLQIENFHWLYHWGPTVSVLTLALLGQSVGQSLKTFSAERIRVFYRIFGIALALHVAVAFYLRHVEINRSGDSLLINPIHRHYLKNLRGQLQPLLAPGSVIAGDVFLTEIVAIHHGLLPLSGYVATLSPSLNDAAWNERIALNEFLGGTTREEFEARQTVETGKHGWGPYARGEGGRDRLLRLRLEAFDGIADDPVAREAYRTRYYVRGSEGRTPPGAKLLFKDAVFQIY